MKPETSSLFDAIKEVVNQARQSAYRASNTLLLTMYWQVGRLIVEAEQQGQAKATYGKGTLKKLSKLLTLEFGTGFDESNLRNMRQFFLAFPIRDAVRHELSWTHYRLISRVENATQRQQYVQLAAEGNWDTRTLQRNIQSQYVGRMLPTDLAAITQPQSLLKDPYIFEFLGLPTQTTLYEATLETALINHIQQFMMELGRGFAFVAVSSTSSPIRPISMSISSSTITY